MPYVLSASALNDIDEIAHYTFYRWGIDAVKEYFGDIEDRLDAIARGEVVMEKYLGGVPNLYFSKVRYHSIYYRVRSDKTVEIARILHDKQNRARHLKKTTSIS